MSKRLIMFIVFINLIILPSVSLNSAGDKQSEWNEGEWSYYQEIFIPLDTSDNNVRSQAIDTRIEFDHSCWAKNEEEHSVRIIYNSKGFFKELESQIYNLEYEEKEYITACNIVFLIPEETNGKEQYFVYYDDEIKNKPDYQDHVKIEESYYFYEPIPGYPFEARYYKITQGEEIVYAIAQEGQSRGVGTSQQVTKLKKGTTSVKPQNSEAVASFEFWYYYGEGIKDYSSTIQQYISSEILVDGNLMVEFKIVSGTKRKDLQTEVTYKYYYCPIEDKRIYAHVKHEALKDGYVQEGENFDGVFAGIQTGGVKSSSIKEFNFGEIPPYLHVFTEQEIIQRYDVDADPEYIPEEWNTPLLNTRDDVDLGTLPWTSFDNGETGKAHSMILDSNSVIKSGTDEKDGVQLKAHESDYPHLPGLECDTASFYFGRNSYEKETGHDLKIPKGLILEFNAEFFSTENGGYKAVQKEAEIFQQLSKIRPTEEGKKSNIVTEQGEYKLTAYAHLAPSVPLGSLFSAAFGINIPYLYAELYKSDGSFISSGSVNRLPSSKIFEVRYDDTSYFKTIADFIRFFDWGNLTYFKKICFKNLLPGEYIVKIYRENPIFNDKRQFIGFQIINVEEDTETHIICKPEAGLQVSVTDQEENEVKDATVMLLSKDAVITSEITSQMGNARINSPYNSRENYLLKIVYKGIVIHEEPIKLGFLRSFIPVKKTINIQLYDLTLEITDSWDLYPEVELNPILLNKEMKEPVIMTGEQISPGVIVFYRIPSGGYQLELIYKSFIFEKNIDILSDTGINLEFPVKYDVKTSVFDLRGDSLNSVKVQVCRQGKVIEKTVDNNGISLFSLPPGTYNVFVHDNDDLIGIRKITIMDDRNIVLITEKETIYPSLIIAIIILFAVSSMIYSYKKKDVMFFIKTISISLIIASLVFPWWMLHSNNSNVESTTSMYIMPVKMVTFTTTTNVAAGEFSFLPNELVDALGFIPILTAIGCILIITSLVLNRLNRKQFSLLSLFIAVITLLCSFILFTYVTSQLTEIGVGGFFGNGNQYVNIPGENTDLTLYSSWGPYIGFYLYLIAIILLITIIIQGIKKLYRKRADLFWHCVEILSCKIDKLSYYYEKLVGTEYNKEYEVFDIKKSKKILHIGCGSYPITALTLNAKYDANIVAIDRREEAIQTANQVINSKKLDNKISVEVGEGEKYPMGDFDTIIISSCSIPKIKILENIFKTAKPKCKIIVRELAQESDLIMDYINSSKNFLVAGEIDNILFFGLKWKSFYLLKKD